MLVVFLAAIFFFGVFTTVGFLAATFDNLTPAALAFLAARLFSLAALFLWITRFLADLSIALWASLSDLALELALKAFRAVFKLRLVLLFKIAALLATLTRFLADLIMGIVLFRLYFTKRIQMTTIQGWHRFVKPKAYLGVNMP